jgi:hypothetical protein
MLKQRDGDFLLKTFLITLALYAAMYFAYQTTGGFLNPAVGMSVGFND